MIGLSDELPVAWHMHRSQPLKAGSCLLKELWHLAQAILLSDSCRIWDELSQMLCKGTLGSMIFGGHLGLLGRLQIMVVSLCWMRLHKAM